MSERDCVTGCGRPTDRMLCTHCLWEIEKSLSELPALLDELTITLTRQGVISKGGGNSKKGTKGKTQPIGFDVRASEMLNDIRTFLSGWVRDIAETYDQELPQDSLRAMSRWLLSRLDIVAVHSAADDIHREITGVAYPPYIGNGRARDGDAWRSVDRPPDRLFIGKCEATVSAEFDDPGDGLARGGVGHWRCEEDVFAKPRQSVARCLACGAEHDVDGRRERIKKELDGRLYTAAEIADLVVYLGDANRGREQTRKLINQWHKRGRLERHQDNHVGEPMFLFGTVMIELAKEEKRRADMVAKKVS